MSITKHLYRLQEVDLDIEAHEASLRQKEGELGDRRELDRAQSNIAALKERLEDLKKQQHSAEWEVDDIASKIAPAEEQLYGGKITNPKELASLQHEVGTMKAKNDELETKALEIIEQVESAENDLAAANSDFGKLEQAWRQKQRQLAEDTEKLKGELADLGQKRRQLAGEAEPQALALYEKVRQLKKPPIAQVEQGICRACRIALPAGELQQVRSGQPVLCGSCGRILFLP
jgi:predicted  nucleic acid-binding Zn-ribbon protein